MKRPFQVFNFSIVNQSEQSADIHIDGDIVDASTQTILENWFGDTTSTSFKSFRNALNKVDVSAYNIIINSQGGHVGDALAIHDWIKEVRAKGKVVNTKGIGVVASASTFILLSGDSPEMTENSYFMIHNVSGGVYGTVDQVENYARTMRLFNNNARDLYANVTGKRPEDISKMMNKETFMTAKEAKENGFIQKVTGSQPFTNKIDADKWMYADTAILNSYNGQVKIPQTNQNDDMKTFLNSWGKDLMTAIKNIATKTPEEKALLESIGNTINTQFEAMGPKMEAAIKEFMGTVPLTAKFDDEAEARIKALEDEQATMKIDLENKIGGESKDNKTGGNKDKYVAKGSFSK